MTTESTEQSSKEFNLQKIYTKDISFETPNSPDIFRQQWQPEINLQLGNGAKALGENAHEVTLSLTVTAKVNKKTAFLIEIQQAGIFTMKGYNDQEIGLMLGAVCPNILFPYAREAISDIVTRGGFPQLLLAPINFDALYHQHLQAAKTENKPAVQTRH